VISTEPNFRIPYKAIGKYKVPGLKGSELFSMIHDGGVEGAYRSGSDEVHVEIYEYLEGSMALDTQFIVTPADSAFNCEQMARSFKAQRQSKGNHTCT